MPLSEYEERVIAAMEEQLIHIDADEPASLLFLDETHSFQPVDATRFVQFGVVAVVTGMAVLLLSFRTSELVASVGFVLFFFGAVSVYEGCRAGGVAAVTRFIAGRRKP